MVTPYQQLLCALQQQLIDRPTTNVELITKPVPASRPRVSKWGTYYGKNYETFRKEAERLLAGVRAAGLTGPLAVLMEVVIAPPSSTKRSYPRGDNDNYEKAVWDSITKSGRVWGDDDQIVLNVTHKRFAKRGEKAGIYLTIIELEDE